MDLNQFSFNLSEFDTPSPPKALPAGQQMIAFLIAYATSHGCEKHDLTTHCSRVRHSDLVHRQFESNKSESLTLDASGIKQHGQK